MSREDYRSRLDELRADVDEMGALARSQFVDAIEVCRTGDRELARQVAEGDHELNDRYLDVEGDCIALLAQQQPVAGDLRLIVASFKIATDLERVGDLATNLADYGAEGHGPRFEGLELDPLAETAEEMLADALAAYRTEDPTACRAVANRDDELDSACERAGEDVVRSLLADDSSSGTDPAEATIADASLALLTLRDLERVGDHAVNVAARTLYMVESDPELIY